MKSNRQVVVDYLDAIAQGANGLVAARNLLADDLDYHDPLLPAATADELIDRLAELDTAAAPIEILEMASSDNTVAVLTEFTMPDDIVVNFTQWFWLRDGKIIKSTVIYDTRPFVEHRPPN